MTIAVTNKPITPEEALVRMQRYCAYQERCQMEVRAKLSEIGISGPALEAVIADLLADDFLNEERFARSFVRGKFRIKGWGKVRIVQELKKRRISEGGIGRALQEIDEEDYEAVLRQTIEKKLREAGASDVFKRRHQAARYVIRRGFESQRVWEVLEELAPENEAHQDRKKNQYDEKA